MHKTVAATECHLVVLPRLLPSTIGAFHTWTAHSDDDDDYMMIVMISKLFSIDMKNRSDLNILKAVRGCLFASEHISISVRRAQCSWLNPSSIYPNINVFTTRSQLTFPEAVPCEKIEHHVQRNLCATWPTQVAHGPCKGGTFGTNYMPPDTFIGCIWHGQRC